MTSNLTHHLEEQIKTARPLMEEYCRLESVSTQNRMMQETADWVENVLKETGFETQQLEVEGAPNYIFAEQKGRSDYTLLLYNHYDVQPEDPIDLWESPPFEPTVRDGNLYARGISDNKSELIARICALRALLAANGELPITIKWIIEGEEEIGSPNFSAMTKTYGDLLQADAACWEGGGFGEDGRGDIALGTRGMLYVEYAVRALARDAHSGSASILPSAAWQLVNMLSSLKDEAGRVRIPGFYDETIPPSSEEVDAYKAGLNDEMEKNFLKMFGLESFMGGKSGLDALLTVYEPTANIAGFETGYNDPGMKTVLPAEAVAKMDFRLIPNQDPEKIFSSLQKHIEDSGFENVGVEVLGSAEPVVIPIDHPFVRRMQEILLDFSGQEARITPLGGGTLPHLGPMKHNVGVLGVLGPGNPVYYGSGAHGPNEHLRLADLPRAIEFNAFLFEQLGEAYS